MKRAHDLSLTQVNNYLASYIECLNVKIKNNEMKQVCFENTKTSENGCGQCSIQPSAKKYSRMKKKTSIFLIFLLFLLTLPLSAQNTPFVKGQVTSVSDGTVLPGVSIVVKGKQQYAVTDINGKFSIKADPESDILIFSMVGYQKLERPLKGLKELSVRLSETEELLGEVMVVGYGVQKKASSVGSISQTKGEELLKVGGTTNISTALAGMLPGVTSISSSGEPGNDQAKIYIRGRSTWGNTDPLILVDGVERGMNDVDPNEIESVSVLKDASATAVFGVKGGNGVILITTKRGKEGTPQISLNANFGFKQPTFSFDIADQVTARELYNEANRNEGAWDIIYSERNIDYWRTHSDPYYHPEINWKEEVFKKFATSQQYNINISGGNKKIKYFTSFGYMKDGDLFKTEKQPEYDPTFRYERYNYRSNINMDITKSTKLSVNIAGNLGVRNRPISHMGGTPFSGSDAGFFEVLYLTPNYVFPIRYENGVLGTTPIGRWWNPIYNLNYQGSATEKTSNLFTDFVLKQDLDFITKGLFVQGKVSYNTNFENQQLIEKDVLAIYQAGPTTPEQWFSDADPVTEWVDKPAVLGSQKLSDYSLDLYYEFSANYAKKWKNHDVTALALFNRRKLNDGSSFPNYEEAWVGRVTYGYANRYLTEFNAAYTGSEKFAPGKRFGFFPSYALGWVISEEPLFKKTKWLDPLTKLKVRYSNGRVGSDRGASRFTYITDYSTSQNAVFGNTMGYAYGPLYYEGQAANTNATWETSEKQNLGVEIGVFSKLSFQVDFFNEKRTGILMTRSNSTPAWFGQEATDANIGKTKSHGYEIEAEWRGRKNKAFSYFIKGGFSFQENRVIFRDDPIHRLEYQKNAGKQIAYDSRLLQDGFDNSWDDVYNYTASIWENAARQPGDMVYTDYNGDGIVDDDDKVPMKLNSIPVYTYSFNLGFSYKNFDLTANFYGVYDVDKMLTGSLLWEFPTKYVTVWPESVGRWTPETAETATRPRMSLSLLKHNRENSTYGVMDASYFRLKSLEVSYNITERFIKKFGLTGCQLYLNGNNLFTFTGFDHRIDPESDNAGAYPLVRRYNIGFRMKF